MFGNAIKPRIVTLARFWPIVKVFAANSLGTLCIRLHAVLGGKFQQDVFYDIQWVAGKTGKEFHVTGSELGPAKDKDMLDVLPAKIAGSPQLRTVMVRNPLLGDQSLLPLPLETLKLVSAEFLSDPGQHNGCTFTVRFRYSQDGGRSNECYLEYTKDERWLFVVPVHEGTGPEYVRQALTSLLSQWFGSFHVDPYAEPII